MHVPRCGHAPVWPRPSPVTVAGISGGRVALLPSPSSSGARSGSAVVSACCFLAGGMFSFVFTAWGTCDGLGQLTGQMCREVFVTVYSFYSCWAVTIWNLDVIRIMLQSATSGLNHHFQLLHHQPGCPASSRLKLCNVWLHSLFSNLSMQLVDYRHYRHLVCL